MSSMSTIDYIDGIKEDETTEELPLNSLASNFNCNTGVIEHRIEIDDLWDLIKNILETTRYTGYICLHYDDGKLFKGVAVDGVIIGAYLYDKNQELYGVKALFYVEENGGTGLVRYKVSTIREILEAS